MLLFSELTDALAKFGPTIEIIIKALMRGAVKPSEFELFIEATETAAARAEISAEFKE